MKYKSCCTSRCLLGTCETRDNGGCYCVCRLKDHEKTQLSLIEGSSYAHKGMVIYEPGKKTVPTPEDVKRYQERLGVIRTKLKEYEIE